MIFYDPLTNTVVNPANLLPDKDYDVYFTIQNDSSSVVPDGETVSITHSAFGIGLPGGNSLLTPPTVTFPEIPPMAYGINGEATGKFIFHTPGGGHGCLLAIINSNGVRLNQNTTVRGVPSGAPSTTGFLVFGNAAANVTLTLTEKVDNAGVISNADATNTWTPKMIAPSGFGPSTPTASPLLLTGLVATAYYTVGLNVNPVLSPTLAHIFTIVGTNTDTGEYVGEVEIRLEPAAGVVLEPSRPFIFGGYQSADVILIDPSGNEVSLGGAPGGAWDTLLIHDTDYRFAARVHNVSGTPAENTVVRFWNFPGGLASNGTLVDIQTVTVPAYGTTTPPVYSEYPFRSAPEGQHSCAVVSISNSMSDNCTVDAVNAIDVPDPGSEGHIGCSAWRNTESRWGYIGFPWIFHLDLGLPHEVWGPGPVEIKVEAQHVPFDWKKNPKYIDANNMLKSAGVHSNKPLFLLPSLRETFKKIDLDIKVKMKEGGKMEQGKDKLSHIIAIDKRNKTAFEVSGIIPKDAKKGDIMLVKVTAHYPKTKLASARNIEFLQVLHVTDKKK
ncbi:MAG TPA: hypothetical protein VIL99_16225 [Ignavibacteria bacterium]